MAFFLSDFTRLVTLTLLAINWFIGLVAFLLGVRNRVWLTARLDSCTELGDDLRNNLVLKFIGVDLILLNMFPPQN